MPYPAGDHDGIEIGITLSSRQVREIASLLTEIRGLLTGLGSDASGRELTEAAGRWLATSGSTYTLPALTGTIEDLATQLSYQARHAVNAAIAAADTTAHRVVRRTGEPDPGLLTFPPEAIADLALTSAVVRRRGLPGALQPVQGPLAQSLGGELLS
jgi:predicted component of type VI protein secretion system